MKREIYLLEPRFRVAETLAELRECLEEGHVFQVPETNRNEVMQPLDRQGARQDLTRVAATRAEVLRSLAPRPGMRKDRHLSEL